VEISAAMTIENHTDRLTGRPLCTL